jgi:hypothetical protein
MQHLRRMMRRWRIPEHRQVGAMMGRGLFMSGAASGAPEMRRSRTKDSSCILHVIWDDHE